jgi:superoxide dismutase, Cu-Zn family
MIEFKHVSMAACAAAWLLAAFPAAGAQHGDAEEAAVPAAVSTARATLRNLEGQMVGQAALRETPHGVLLRARFEGLPPGTRAFHIHEKGVCEPPFTSAGGHFNPHGRKHGLDAPEGHHAGDLPNLHVPPETGVLEIEVMVPGVTLKPGPTSLLEGDGKALVVHAGPDDHETDPAGDAGERIACGVIEPVGTP